MSRVWVEPVTAMLGAVNGLGKGTGGASGAAEGDMRVEGEDGRKRMVRG